MFNILLYVKLKIRANKYKNRNDRGGISYILNHVNQGDTVIDVGAHKAGYLYFMRKKVGLNGTVHAFEPQNSLFKNLVKFKASLNWDNVILSDLALSDVKSQAVLHIPLTSGKSDSPGASILNLVDNEGKTIEQVTLTDTLDYYCEKNNIRPSFIKIDVEGNELNVLKGAMSTLTTLRPRILIETEERHIGRENVETVFQTLIKLGYRGFFIRDKDILPIEQFDFGLHQNIKAKPYSNNFIFENRI